MNCWTKHLYTEIIFLFIQRKHQAVASTLVHKMTFPPQTMTMPQRQYLCLEWWSPSYYELGLMKEEFEKFSLAASIVSSCADYQPAISLGNPHANFHSESTGYHCILTSLRTVHCMIHYNEYPFRRLHACIMLIV